MTGVRADAARNRQRVLDAARALYTTRGLDEPMEQIARAAGVGVGTVYRHFPDRAALVRAVIADRLAHVGRLVAA
ncbi:helix-turn-helix transcriptional regulator, partial [Cellulomonas hominis]|nr:helix-turn-helix transcriptional regulator [Cellulomonas hominis]